MEGCEGVEGCMCACMRVKFAGGKGRNAVQNLTIGKFITGGFKL